MKKYIYVAALAAMSSLFVSCSQEEVAKVNSAKAGDPISFTASTQAVETRTVYGNTLNANNKWDINWVKNDEVTVFCPQASKEGGNQQTAVYTVSASENKNVYDITSQTNLCWGPEDMHHFYEVYPASDNNVIGENGILTAVMPSSQRATLQANGYYADMSAALMAGTTDCPRTAIPEDGLNLKFKPIFTAVDITVSASTNQPFTLQSIDVANIESETAIKPLAGKFTYDFNGNYTSVSAQEESHNVRVWFPDENGDPTSITLSNEEDNADAVKEVKVTVFLRGDFNNAVKIVLNGNLKSATDPFKPVMLKKQGAIGQKIVAEARNHVELGSIPTEKVQPMTGEWWVSHTPDLTYVSQMSLPGAYDAANFVNKITGDDRAQTKLYSGDDDDANRYYNQMKAYLNGGIRAFDLKLSYSEDESKYPGHWYTNRVANAFRSPEAVNFTQFVEAGIKWLQAHTTEFLIVFLSDYEAGSSTTGTSNYVNHASDLITQIPEQYLLTNFGPEITVAEARGKILVVNGTPVNNPIGMTVTGWVHNNKYNRTASNEVALKSYPMAGNIGSGTLYVHDYNNLYHTDEWVGLSHKHYYDWVNKHAYLTSAFTSCKNDMKVSHWYYIGACARYWSAGSEDISYSDSMNDNDNVTDGSESGNLRKAVYDWTKGLSNGDKYERTGIVMMAYVCNGTRFDKDGKSITLKNDKSNQKEYDAAESVEDAIWANNYKGDGAPLAPRK